MASFRYVIAQPSFIDNNGQLGPLLAQFPDVSSFAVFLRQDNLNCRTWCVQMVIIKAIVFPSWRLIGPDGRAENRHAMG